MTGTYCLVTKTYAGDLQSFRMLCESIDAVMPGVRHYVVIDRADAALFAQFAAQNRKLLVSEDVLPGFAPFSALGRNWWYRRPLHFVRGWLFQQLAKLAAVSTLEEDAAILVDSDAVFLRPLRPEQIFGDGKVKLYHRPGAQSGPASQSAKWHNAASRALGLRQSGYTGADYISTVIAWSPAIVRGMLAHIEAVTGRKWHDEMLRDFRFSECVLYGVFCEHVEGPHQAFVVPTRQALCHWCWGYDLTRAEEIAAYAADFGPEKVAALIQSNLSLPDGKRAEIFAAIRQKLAANANAQNNG